MSEPVYTTEQLAAQSNVIQFPIERARANGAPLFDPVTRFWIIDAQLDDLLAQLPSACDRVMVARAAFESVLNDAGPRLARCAALSDAVWAALPPEDTALEHALEGSNVVRFPVERTREPVEAASQEAQECRAIANLLGALPRLSDRPATGSSPTPTEQSAAQSNVIQFPIERARANAAREPSPDNDGGSSVVAISPDKLEVV